ncbi:threonine synthase [Chitinasiproducens palmae]|uniref:Threonine synthase n=1 Tax=Chitinasiproducens palmae TaxID=1770053 RepID=A0A1H2PLX9_9BURK|nr:threonine synthase [Chitinasiproducens palmae]SDV47529.1 L-threonine synthase [Chitinasiproducens palmae]
MKYVSTRGAAAGQPHSFLDILLGGLAPDGGLFMPLDYPRITADELRHFRTLDYAALACEILAKFADDIDRDTLAALTRRTYTAEVYRHTRRAGPASDITPLSTLGSEGGTTLSLLELSNGPTLAFKDMAMQLLGNLFEHALARDHATLNIVGATSGDTGSAAEYAMRGKRGVRVFMLSPHNKMSAFQRAQMYSLDDPNIFNLAVQGVFDDCQDIVKAISNDAAFKARHRVGTVNSINWARVVAQVVYYFKGYLAAFDDAAWQAHAEAPLEAMPKVSFTVPSGNFGNVCAGHIARMMGLPIARLVVATNENDVLDEFFRTGAYRVRSAAETRQTTSPSMDISKASNFERFVFDLFERDSARVAGAFEAVASQGGFDLGGTPEFDAIKHYGFVSGRSNHADRIATIRDVDARYRTTIDTHTADGVCVARRYLEPGVPMIVLETAQPVKFGETIREALGHEPDRPADFVGIEALPQHVTVVPAEAERVKAFVAEHSAD